MVCTWNLYYYISLKIVKLYLSIIMEGVVGNVDFNITGEKIVNYGVCQFDQKNNM